MNESELLAALEQYRDDLMDRAIAVEALVAQITGTIVRDVVQEMQPSDGRKIARRPGERSTPANQDRLVELLRERGSLTTNQISRHLNVARSSACAIVLDLKRRGMVEPLSGYRYRLKEAS